jgi:hypothetical protein
VLSVLNYLHYKRQHNRMSTLKTVTASQELSLVPSKYEMILVNIQLQNLFS